MQCLIGTGLECYTCGHEGDECTKDNYGEKVHCQMDDPENHNYGDSCYVGHSGSSKQIYLSFKLLLK